MDSGTQLTCQTRFSFNPHNSAGFAPARALSLVLIVRKRQNYPLEIVGLRVLHKTVSPHRHGIPVQTVQITLSSIQGFDLRHFGLI